MAKTSIHICPVKGTSEAHNLREKFLDYVNPELSSENEHEVLESIADRQSTVRANYEKTVGQKMQKSATPIREGVVVIRTDTTMAQLKDFTQKCESELGVKAFQIHIHRDEGRWDNGTWVPNPHAHIVFDFTKPNGKSLKLGPKQMARMQTILAESLGMERGVSSDVQHLNAIQFKNKAEAEKLHALLGEVSSVQEELKSVTAELNNARTKENLTKVLNKATGRLADAIGISGKDKQIKSLTSENTQLKGKVEGLTKDLDKAKARVTTVEFTMNGKNNIINKKNKEMDAIKGEARGLLKMLSPDAAKMVRTTFPLLFKAANFVNDITDAAEM